MTAALRPLPHSHSHLYVLVERRHPVSGRRLLLSQIPALIIFRVTSRRICGCTSVNGWKRPTLTNLSVKKNNQSTKEVKEVANNSTTSAKAKKPAVKEREVRDLKPRKDPMGGAKPQRGIIIND